MTSQLNLLAFWVSVCDGATLLRVRRDGFCLFLLPVFVCVCLICVSVPHSSHSFIHPFLFSLTAAILVVLPKDRCRDNYHYHYNIHREWY